MSECNHESTKVVETRGNRRRRECKHCGYRYTTIELPLESMHSADERIEVLMNEISAYKRILRKVHAFTSGAINHNGNH